MREDEHLEKARQIEETARTLYGMDKDKHYITIVNNCFQAAHHYIEAYLSTRPEPDKEIKHPDDHDKITRVLTEINMKKLADDFRELKQLCIPRRYGRATDGESADDAVKLLDRIKKQVG